MAKSTARVAAGGKPADDPGDAEKERPVLKKIIRPIRRIPKSSRGPQWEGCANKPLVILHYIPLVTEPQLENGA